MATLPNISGAAMEQLKGLSVELRRYAVSKEVGILRQAVEEETPEKQSELWRLIFAYIAKSGDVGMMDALCSGGAEITLGGTLCPLHLATLRHAIDMVDYLLRSGHVQVERTYFQDLLQGVAHSGAVQMMGVYLEYASSHGKRAYPLFIPQLKLLKGCCWQTLQTVDKHGFFTESDPLNIVILYGIGLPSNSHHKLIRTLEFCLQARGRALFHRRSVSANQLPDFGFSWWWQYKVLFKHNLPRALTGGEERAAKSGSYLPGRIHPHMMVERLAKRVSAYAVVDYFYTALARKGHWIAPEWRKFLFRKLGKARRLWMKAFTHVRRGQRLLREQEAAEVADERHLPGGKAHTEFLMEAECIESTLGKRARDEDSDSE